MPASPSSDGEPSHTREPTCRNHEDAKNTKIHEESFVQESLRASSCFRGFVVPVVALRIAVIGVGHLGKHHARILAALPGVELVAVVDTNRARAEEIAAAHGTQPLFDARDLDGRVDAVTVAVPTAIHRDIARPFLDAGIAALVEKPLARSLAEADDLIAAAHRSKTILAVGH